MSLHDTYARVEKAKDALVACSLELTSASRWARHRLGVVGLIKYWYLRRARRYLAAAQQLLSGLQAELRSLAEPTVGDTRIDTADMVADAVLEGDVFLEMRISEEIDTALLTVNSYLDDVGALLARMRAKGAGPRAAAG